MSDEPTTDSSVCVLCGEPARVVVEDLGPVCTSCLPRATWSLQHGVPFSDQ